MVKTVLNFWDVVKQIDENLTAAGWTLRQKKAHIYLTYNAKSLKFLQDEELWEFLEFSKSLSKRSLKPCTRFLIQLPSVKKYG